MKCQKCNGCGRVADSENQEPWSVWMELPVKSSLALLMGLVKPILCSVCNGSGKVKS